eukprot:TRINITY_DN13820_c0_g1_i1.p1 TRINITY_DN13820_c0_g1~~TRINITY_DN13820_c0_g1_i1.p1  ORF type:complete len:681 (-),score=142.26 TRINITY_DN13820_c0_g1_i1:81-1958(-)
MEAGDDCGQSNGTLLQTKHFQLKKGSSNLEFILKSEDVIYSSSQDTYYICVQAGESFIHQGTKVELSIQFYTRLMPIWLMIVLVTLLLCLSGLFSGLNLGLMALDQTELQIVVKTGTESEQADAKSIMPVRALGNFLLCSLLLGNVLVNNTLTIMLDALTGGGGLIAVIGSTFGIVIFGEIIPQAVCSRHGLAVGAKTLGITKFFMLVTSPLSFPISKLLDCVLGVELGTVYNRARLIELLRVTQENIDLNKDEVNILTGALVLQEKKVEDIMTPIGDCYMLNVESVLDFKTISEIKDKGYSRIPVYEDEESNVVHILLTKDLLFVDPDDKKPLAEICQFYKTPFTFVDKNMPLNKMLDDFKTGENGHLAIVKGDEENNAIGLVTLEDIIEEIIQAEIIDETDIVLDNKSKTKRGKKGRFLKEKEFRMFIGTTSNKVDVSPQTSLAVLQFLSTSLAPFHVDNLKTDVLKKMLMLDVFRESKFTNDDEARENPILRRGKPCEHFILIIEGKVEVEIGVEGYVFESGSFTSFGKQVLEQVLEFGTPAKEGTTKMRNPSQMTWIPECTIIPKTDVLYLKIRHNTYKAALLASRVNVGVDGEETVEKHLKIMMETQTSDNGCNEKDPLI